MGEHFQSGLVRLGSHVIGEFGSLETRKYFTTVCMEKLVE